MTEVGPTLRRLRHARGLMQWELALITGVPQPTISGIEKGTRLPGIAILKKLSTGLGYRLRVKLVPEESR